MKSRGATTTSKPNFYYIYIYIYIKYNMIWYDIYIYIYIVGYISTIYFCDKVKGKTHRSNYKQY